MKISALKLINIFSCTFKHRLRDGISCFAHFTLLLINRLNVQCSDAFCDSNKENYENRVKKNCSTV